MTMAHRLALIDVGSTMIKSVIIEDDGTITQEFHERSVEKSISAQVDELIAGWPKNLEIRFCSSANKGLRVGLICVTSRYSGSASAHCLETMGSNIIYLLEARDLLHVPPPQVDVLAVVGGVDAYPSGAMKNALKNINLQAWPHDKLVFAGHRECREWVGISWPNAIIVENPLQTGLFPESKELANLVRETYLNDIESKRELRPLQALTEQLIEPTPAVVSRAFQRLIEYRRAPDLILDVGGATTDIHYSKELFDDDADSATLAMHQSVGRHVYTGYGVHESRISTIDALLHHPRCHDFLGALHGDDHRQVYVDLLDRVIANDLLFYACVFLSLSDLSEARLQAPVSGGPVGAPPLNLQRAVSLGITGGAAKNTDKAGLARVVTIATGARIEPVLDDRYRWWTMGMLNEHELANVTWESFDV